MIPGRRSGMRAPRTGGPVGAALILLTSMQFGGVVVLGKIATRPGGLPIPSLLAVRFAIAAILLGAALLVLRQPLRAARGEGSRLVVLGTVGYAVEAGLFFSALRHGTAAAVTLLFFTYPVMVAIVAFLSGKGFPGWLLGGALAAATAGAAIVAVAGGGVAVDGFGVLFALGSALMITFFLTGTDAVLKATNSLTGAMWVSASAAVGLAAYAVATGTGRMPVRWHQWWPVLGMAAFTAGAFVCLLAGLRRLGVIRTSILSATEPLTAAALAAVFLGESVRPGTVAGGVLILAGAVTASIARGRVPAEPTVP